MKNNIINKRNKVKISIMQPYLFPYIGYYQLINFVDKFVFYDDVSFIKRKWINRNYILVNGMPYRFTVPLSKASQNKLILDTFVDEQKFVYWREKFIKTIFMHYKFSPYRDKVINLISKTLSSDYGSISKYCSASISNVMNYLDLKINNIQLSSLLGGKDLSRVDRLIYITKKLGGDTYVNNDSGKNLYSEELFKEKEIYLLFFEANIKEYTQKSKNQKFIPSLSILDILMNCSKRECRDLLQTF